MIISPKILIIAYIIIFIAAIVASAVFVYHWKQYGTHMGMTKLIITIYSVITLGLLITAAILLKMSII